MSKGQQFAQQTPARPAPESYQHATFARAVPFDTDRGLSNSAYTVAVGRAVVDGGAKVKSIEYSERIGGCLVVTCEPTVRGGQVVQVAFVPMANVVRVVP